MAQKGMIYLGENNYYIRCKNFAGEINDAEFAVKIFSKGGPDLTPPLVNRFDIDPGTYLAKGTNSTEIRLYVNEPAECRWSIQDKDYDNMEN